MLTFNHRMHYRVSEAATITGYSEWYLRRLCQLGALKARKLGSNWLIEVRSLNDFLEKAAISSDGRKGPRSKA